MYVCCIKPFKFDTFPEFGVFVCFYVWLQYFAFVAPMFLLLSFLFFFSCFYIRCLLCALLLTDKSTEKKAKKRISIFFCRESQFFFKISSVWRYVNFVLDKKNSVDFYGLFALVEPHRCLPFYYIEKKEVSRTYVERLLWRHVNVLFLVDTVRDCISSFLTAFIANGKKFIIYILETKSATLFRKRIHNVFL